jgi:predicted AlkP superfamily phosphohydrolase/phosphomutase
LENRFPYHGRSNTFSEILGRIVRRQNLNSSELDKVIEYLVELYDRRKLAAAEYLRKKYPLMDETIIEEMTQTFIDSMPMSYFDEQSDLYDEKRVEEYNRERGLM